MSRSGRYLLFLSFGRLTPDDKDNVQDLYRYDMQTGELIRISFGRNGNDGNGNDDQFPVKLSNPTNGSPSEFAEDGSREISANGNVVVFETAAPLVSRDNDTGTNPKCEQHFTGCDVYEWEAQGEGTCSEAGGCIRLISSGVAVQGTGGGLIDESGRNISFQSSQNLGVFDTDGSPDVFDARVEGGFHRPATQPECESADQCHGAVPAESAAPSFTTETFASPGNAVEHRHCAKGKVRIKKHGQVRCVARHHHKRKGKRRLHRNGAATGGGK